MATKLTEFNFDAPSRMTSGDKAIYPWDDWFDGDIWQLEQGTDFDTHPLMMERIIRTRATGKGAKIRMRHQPLNGDSWGVIVLERTDIEGPEARDNRLAAAAAKRAAKKAAAEPAKAAAKKPAASKKAAAPAKKTITKKRQAAAV
jgi:hypothetical protein